MMNANKIKAWLNDIDDNADIAVDDGGLCLVELDADGVETGNYIELGGIPLKGFEAFDEAYEAFDEAYEEDPGP